MGWIIGVTSLLTSILTLGAQEDRPRIRAIPGPREAHALALQDAKTLANGAAAFTRWVWVPVINVAELPSMVKQVVMALGFLGTESLAMRPKVIGDAQGGMAMVRVDLRMFAGDKVGDIDRWLRTWEKLTFDPAFSRYLTSDNIKLLTDRGFKLPQGITGEVSKSGKLFQDTEPYTDTDGSKVRGKWVNVVRFAPDYADPKVLSELEAITGSVAPVVSWQYLINRGTASIQDDSAKGDNNNLYRDLHGGLYYQFAGVRTAKESGKKKGTDLDVLFQDLGLIDDADGGVDAFKKLADANADQRVLIDASRVAHHKPRIVVALATPVSVRHRSVVTITMDVAAENIDRLKRAHNNLLDFRPDAYEVIWTKSNGTQGYAMFNGAGALAFEVPFNIATDYTVPTGFSPRLDTQGCITCHGQQGGWQPAPNGLLRAKTVIPKLDLSDAQRTVLETQLRMARVYGGDMDNMFRTLRTDTAEATLRFTGPFAGGKGDQTDLYQRLSQEHLKTRTAYWHTDIDAGIALREWGVDCGKHNPQDVLRDLLKPDPSGLEDDVAGRLMDGRPVARSDFNLFWSVGAARVRQALTAREGKP